MSHSLRSQGHRPHSSSSREGSGVEGIFTHAMCHLLIQEVWLGGAALGSGEGCVWTRQARGPRILEVDSELYLVAVTHTFSLLLPNQLFSTRQSPPLWAARLGARVQKIPKVFPKGNQSGSCLPDQQSDLPHRVLGRNNKIRSFSLS